MSGAKNVLGGPLKVCCMNPKTGFYRTGRCDTGAGDEGVHVVCARMTVKFLEFSEERGNDLSTPAPQFGFPGLKPGNCWCLCAARWKEALEAGAAPPVVLESTHMSALEFIDLEDLQRYAVDRTVQGEPGA
jgi:uncharacterized protein (DUF2237 family)